MENNQEHKIDKIFRETFENQEITPPSDAWMGIHTYTIGQEEKNPKVWLKYASLALLILVVSGFGLWYIVDNEIVTDKNSAKLLSQKVVSEDTDHGEKKTELHSYEVVSEDIHHGEKNADRVQNPASVKMTDQISYKTNITQTKIIKFIPIFSKKILSDSNFSEIQNYEIKPLITEKVEDSSVNENTEPTPFFKDVEMKEIESKQLIMNDLSDKFQKESQEKIVVLGKKIEDKKKVYDADSVNYGSKFSLRHPIITFGIFGTAWNFWNFGEKVFNRTYFPNERNTVVKIGFAWKVNRKLRIGISLGTSHYGLGKPEVNISPISSASGGTNVKLTQINSDQFYQAETPFGNVNIDVSQFKNSPYFDPNNLDSYRRLDYYGVLPHSMQTTSLSLNSQYDLFTVQRKRGKRYSYQIYGLADINIQRQASYFYTAIEPYYNSSFAMNSINIYTQNNHLQNASEFVFGLRTGLGFRYQFARKWDFYVEGSGQHSLNNWVKSDDIKTFQRALSLQAGINLNL